MVLLYVLVLIVPYGIEMLILERRGGGFIMF